MELLVVLSVVALLTALLLPGVSSVKTAAQSMGCQSNLRQLSLAFMAYAQDNDGQTVVPWLSVKTAPWSGLLYDYYDQTAKVLWCPGNRKAQLRIGSFAQTGGPATLAARRSYALFSQYGPLPLIKAKVLSWYPDWVDPHVTGSTILSQIDGTGTGMFTDAWDGYINPLTGNGIAWNNHFDSWTGAVMSKTYWVNETHRSKANISFCDGHIESRTAVQTVGPGGSVGMINPDAAKGLWTTVAGD
jgi:prepilin-type processing-associated H-X9-DG protein